MSQQEEFIKLLMIGDSGVGKSCILTRFCDDRFIDAFYNTIGVDFKTKHIMIEKKKVKLQIWDTAGQERFRTITSNYYKGAHGILIVFDLTNKQSLRNVDYWLEEIEKHGKAGASRILIGNKCDMADKRKVSEEEAVKYAKQNGLEYIESSAFNALNIQLVFETIAKKVMRSGNSSATKLYGKSDNKNKSTKNETTIRNESSLSNATTLQNKKKSCC